MNTDGTLTCSEGMQSDGANGCEPEGGAQKVGLLSDLNNGIYDKLDISTGDFAGLYKMEKGLGKATIQSILY